MLSTSFVVLRMHIMYLPAQQNQPVAHVAFTSLTVRDAKRDVSLQVCSPEPLLFHRLLERCVCYSYCPTCGCSSLIRVSREISVDGIVLGYMGFRAESGFFLCFVSD